jgi:DNA-binding LacI/PurR family transcriptional regulator
MGQTAVQFLLRHIGQPGEPPERIVLPPLLSIRQSSSGPRRVP